MKSNGEWSSQLWPQFIQLRKKAEKNSGLQLIYETRDLAILNGAML